MTPDGLSQTHAAAFGAARGWSSADFERYLEDVTVSIFGDNRCFAVVRRVGPEAEILTLATHPEDQGGGHATRLLQDALTTMARAKIEDVFLEVSDTNTAARALYEAAGFVAFGTRPDYYPDGASAICMKLELSSTSTAQSEAGS